MVRGVVTVRGNIAHRPLCQVGRPIGVALTTKRRVTIIKEGKTKGDVLMSAVANQ